MNITFFIGNGFDMKIGLKTSYSDFYPEFLREASDSNMIKEWLMENIKKYGEENFTDILWSDLEETLGKKLDRVKEDEVEKFIRNKREMDLLLINYLEEEQIRLRFKGQIFCRKRCIIGSIYLPKVVNFLVDVYNSTWQVSTNLVSCSLE